MFARTGEDRLLRLIPEIRNACESNNTRHAASLLTASGSGQMAESDLIAAVGAINDDGIAGHSAQAAVDMLHRRVRRVAITSLVPRAQELDTEDLVDAVFQLWETESAELVCRIIRTEIGAFARYPENTSPQVELGEEPVDGEAHTSAVRQAERAQMKLVDRMMAGLARHALNQGHPASGYKPESVTETAKQFALAGAKDTPGVEIARFGYGEVSVLDPEGPSAALRSMPTMRARRIMNAVVRMPELDIFWAVSGRARSAIDTSQQSLSETLDLVESDLTRKVLTDVDGADRPASALDLTRIADGAGFTGWARRVATTVAGSKRRDVRLRRLRAQSALLEMPCGTEEATRDNLAAVFAADGEAASDWSTAEDQVDAALNGDVSTEDATESADVVRHAASPLERKLIGAHELHRAFMIPALVAPADPVRREQLYAALDENPSLAARSLKAHHDRLVGASTRDQVWIPEDACDLWLEFDERAADDLLGRSSGVVEVVAQAAVLPSPVLRARTMIAFTEILLDASGAPTWSGAATGLADAYRALTSRPAPSKASAARWQAALEVARAVPGSPVPSDNVDAAEWCRHLAITALVRVRGERATQADAMADA